MAQVASENGDTISLNVMPMLDIFSILILFLLMNFSSDPLTYELHEAIDLPESRTIISLDEVPAISVTRNEVFVNDHKIAEIMRGDIIARQTEQGGVLPLYLELKKLAEANARLVKVKDSKELSGITLEMDKSHSFKLLRKVMLSAQQSDFIKFKLMVSKPIE